MENANEYLVIRLVLGLWQYNLEAYPANDPNDCAAEENLDRELHAGHAEDAPVKHKERCLGAK